MTVTILDIAKASGKSYPTVSRALNNHPKISEKTKSEIRAVAERLGYRPSFAGLALQTGRTRMIGVLVGRLQNPYFSMVIDCLRKELQSHRYSTVLFTTNYETEQEKHCLDMILRGCCDGVCLWSKSPLELLPDLAKLAAAKIPAVIVGPPVNPPLPIDALRFDEAAVQRQIIRRMAEGGHRHFATLSSEGAPELSDLPAGIVMKYWREAWSTTRSEADDAYRLVLKEFPKHPETTVLLCGDDLWGCGALRAFEVLKKQVPRDVSVFGKDNTWCSRYAALPLSTIDLNAERTAHLAAECLLRRLNGSEWGPPENHDVPLSIVYRESHSFCLKGH